MSDGTDMNPSGPPIQNPASITHHPSVRETELQGATMQQKTPSKASKRPPAPSAKGKDSHKKASARAVKQIQGLQGSDRAK
jgi:hypothetical protein